jgi:guanylate kinase
MAIDPNQEGSGVTVQKWRKGRGILFVVSAPSGAGKTSLCREIVQWVPNLQHSISYTTRQVRTSETPGADYHFISQEMFEGMVQAEAFIEWAAVHNNYYGTSRKDLQAILGQGIDVILDIDSQGAMQIKRRYDNGVFIYILPPSFEDLRQRLTGRRADAPDEIHRRLARAREEIRDYEAYDYLIVNDDFQHALDELKCIILSERGRMSRVDQVWIQKTFLTPQE